MIAKAFPLDRLLRKYIASAEEDLCIVSEEKQVVAENNTQP